VSARSAIIERKHSQRVQAIGARSRVACDRARALAFGIGVTFLLFGFTRRRKVPRSRTLGSIKSAPAATNRPTPRS
jgi:hypothetical protein